jgi:hypothetical protein
MYYALDWKSQKQGRVSSSTLGAELLACAQAERDNVSWTHAIRYTINAPVTNRVIVDSRGLADHLAHPGNHLLDVRLEAVAASLRESLATADLGLLQWVSSRHNLSDGLTKRNPTAWRYLHRFLTQIPCTPGEYAFSSGGSVAYTSTRADDIIDSTIRDGSQESPRSLPKTILDPGAYLRSKAGRSERRKGEHSEKEA